MAKYRLLIAAVTSTAILVLPSGAAVAKSGGGGGGSSGPTTALIQFKQGSYSVADNAGQAAVSVVRSGNTANDVSAYFTMAGGTATAGTDYTNTFGPVEFTPRVTTMVVHIPVMTDGPYDGNETVNMYLSNPQVLASSGGSAQLGSKNSTTLTIMDTSPTPTLSVNSPAPVNEGSVVNFTVSITGTSGLPVSVNYATSNGSATSPGNYTATNGSLSWAPGDTSTRTVTVHTVDNGTVDSPNPLTFYLNLSGAINATITTAQGTGSITEIDPGIAIADSSVWLPTSGTATLYFPVTLTGTPAQDTTVNWTTTSAGTGTFGNGSNNICAGGHDFITGSGALIFPAHTGALTQYIGVTVCGESTALADDTVWVHLTGTSYGSIYPSYGVGTLHNSVPASTSVTLDYATLNLGLYQNAHVKVLNTSGLGIPNAQFRGEIWRDRNPQDGFVQLIDSGVANTNGNTDGSSEFVGTWTNGETVGAQEWYEACVPGMSGATLSTCGQTMTDPDGDPASYENTMITANPAGPTFTYASFLWNGPSQTVDTFSGAAEAVSDNVTVTFSGPVCRTAAFSASDWSASGYTTGANPVVGDTIPLCGSGTVTSATVELQNYWVNGLETVTITLNSAVLVNGNGALVVPPQQQAYLEDGT